MAGFIHSLDIPDHVRILAPDQIGHGKDLERAKSHPDLYEHPTQLTLLESTSEFLDAVNVGSNTNAFGISLGGGLAYYLRLKRPDVIQKTVLVSPAIPFCINHTYMDDFVGGRKNFMCFEDRQDVKHLFRDLSTGQENNDKRLKKDPVPTFFLEAIYRANKKTAPEGHYRDMLHGLLVILNEDHAKSSEGEEKDMSKMMTAEQDIDKESQRLVLWPEEDRIVSYQNGKHFFEDSLIPGEENEIIKSGGRTRFVSIPDCGHVFHADGTIILAIDWVRNEIRNFLIDLAPEMESRS
jgi:pimeloyl-ACP methyl ester carboxylesterase